MSRKMTFALAFCNRGFMPGELIYGAREDMIKAVTDAGYDYIAMDAELTRYGGIETREEGLLYAKWLKEHEGQYDGVIFSMPIFADENGAITALQDAGVPILMQAYPDEIGKMDFAHRRDAYCGKFSVTDVFTQYNVPFTVMKPHVVHPLSEAFAQNLKDFAAICRVVNGMKRFNVGCIGARTTAFKTVRFDEITLQKYGINVESFDLSELVYKVEHKADDDMAVLEKIRVLENYTDFTRVPESNKITLAKISVVIDEYIEEYHLDGQEGTDWQWTDETKTAWEKLVPEDYTESEKELYRAELTPQYSMGVGLYNSYEFVGKEAEGYTAYLNRLSERYVPYLKEPIPQYIHLTKDEYQAESLYGTPLMNYVEESEFQFITGVMDVEKDWESYLSKLESYKYKELETIYNDALARSKGGE